MILISLAPPRSGKSRRYAPSTDMADTWPRPVCSPHRFSQGSSPTPDNAVDPADGLVRIRSLELSDQRQNRRLTHLGGGSLIAAINANHYSRSRGARSYPAYVSHSAARPVVRSLLNWRHASDKSASP